MADTLAIGYGTIGGGGILYPTYDLTAASGGSTIGGGGITYFYTTYELTAETGTGTIGAGVMDIGLSGQTLIAAVGNGVIGAGVADLGFRAYSGELVRGNGTISTGATELRDIVRALFPALSPSSRNFTPPEYAVSSYKTINGAKSRRLWASQPGGASLDMEFVNITDANAETILAAHDVAKGAANDLILPDAVLSGAEGDLLTYMRSPGGQAWAFDGPPEVQSVKEGISTVRVKLAARRKARFDSVGGVGGTFEVGAALVDEIDPISFDDCDFIGRAPDEGPSPAPGDLWVSKLASGGSYSIGGTGNIEYGAFGNSYHVLQLENSGSRLAIIKRNRAGSVLWQRVSNPILSQFYFADIKSLSNGNVVVYVAGLAFGNATQRLLMFSSSGVLLRSRSFVLGWPQGMGLRDQTSAQIWGLDLGIFTNGKPFLLTVSLMDSAAFGDTIGFYKYDTPSTNSGNYHAGRDVRRLSNGNLIFLVEYYTPAVTSHCLELNADGSSLVQNAAFVDSPVSGRAFSQAIPYADGTVVLTTGTGAALKIDSSFDPVWYKTLQIPDVGPMRAILDSSENLYYAGRVASGAGGAPAGFTGAPGVSIEKIDSGFTAVNYSTWCNNGMGSAAYAYLGANSGLDIVNNRFIGCSENGNNVASHNILMPGATVNLALSGGQTAIVGTQNTVPAPIADPVYTPVRSTPAITITSLTLAYVSETWTFTDPGSALAWDLFVSP